MISNYAMMNDVDNQDDIVTAGGNYILESDIYTAKITQCYEHKSPSGAYYFNFKFLVLRDSSDNPSSVREFETRIYTTNRKGEPFYIKDNTKKPLPGFTRVNSLFKLVAGRSLPQLTVSDVESKIVELYDPSQGGMAKTEVSVYTPVLNQEICIGVIKKIVNKYSNGEPTSETKETNELLNFFDTATHKTSTEIEKQASATSYNNWLNKHKGTIKNEATKASAAPVEPRHPNATILSFVENI